jgi:hypothetical protein
VRLSLGYDALKITPYISFWFPAGLMQASAQASCKRGGVVSLLGFRRVMRFLLVWYL